MERTCKITPRNTAHLGAPTVPAERIFQTVAPIASEKMIDGNISSESQEQLNNLCSSARASGSVDDEAFVEGMEKAGLTVNCSLCEYHS